jgi:hypothetical protein
MSTIHPWVILVDFSYSVLTLWFSLAPKDFNIFGFSIFFDHDLLFNGCPRNASYTLNLKSTFL